MTTVRDCSAPSPRLATSSTSASCRHFGRAPGRRSRDGEGSHGRLRHRAIPCDSVKGTLAITGDSDADRLLNTDPLALLIGMLLDQQVPMEWAFRGPSTLRERLGRPSTPARSRRCRRRPRSGVRGEARAAPLPGVDGRAHHALCDVRRRGVRRRRRRTIWKGVETRTCCSSASARCPATATRRRRSSSPSSASG